MAPIRKSRNLNQLSFKGSKYSPSNKDAANDDNSWQHEREVSNKLGCQWSKDELQRFYRAYKKYGKDWEKIAGIVRRRSVEMVEALYNMNMAYLSLPNGTVVGLISVMNDYYNMTDSDDCKRESNKKLKIVQRSQKCDVGKKHNNASKSSAGLAPSMSHSMATSASNGRLSLSKNRCSGGNIPRIVGKRTPRFPVSHPYSKGDVGKFLSPSKSDASSEEGNNADEVAQGNFGLTKVLEREGCSQMPKRKAEHVSLSPVLNYGASQAETTIVGNKLIGDVEGDCWEGNLGTRKDGNKDSARERTNTIKISKRKKFHQKKSNLQYTRSDYYAPGETDKPKKRSKQLLSEDERAALDALNTLADSLPNLEATSTAESGPEENGDNQTLTGEDSALEVGLIPEEKQWNQPTSRLKRRKCTSLSSKIPEADSVINCIPSKRQKNQGKSAPQESASRGDLQKQRKHLSLPTEQVPTVKQFHLPGKTRKHKLLPQKQLAPNRLKSPENAGNDSAHSLQKKLSHCLSSESLQRWCAYEWFYSPMDYPWFTKREFMEYLNHVRLGHVQKLTRVEWGVIRSSLGKPRRLSQQFLTEEKDKLEQYRESVREHYTRLRSGIVEAIPSDLALPLQVGERVIARHPKSRGLYEGSILTVERDRCRIQFDSPELGVEFVMDIDCMPLDMVDNVPGAFRKEHIAVDKDQRSFNEFITAKNVGYIRCAPRENLESADGSYLISSPAHPVISPMTLAEGGTVDKMSQDKAIARKHDIADEVTQTHPCDVGQIQSGDADIQALSDLSRALDKKEALVSEIRFMNSEVLKNQNGDESIRDSELFRRQYASIRVQLKEVSDQVDSSLLYLRRRNMYQENSPRPWLKPVDRSSCPRSYFDHSAVSSPESTSNVVEVFESSRRKAQEMLDAATRAMSSLTEGEDVYRKIGEALDYTNCQDFGVDSSIPAVRSLNHSNPSHDLPCESQATASIAEQRMMDQPTESKLNIASETVKVQIPSALISSCVATFLMIQRCSERRYPPAETAEILESAIKSLQPCCSQNIPIYRDIEMCMGMVKNQILALIPT